MGANFETMKSTSHDIEATRREFEAAQDSDRYDNGHSYSGGLGMADGLKFVSLPPFDSEDAAYDWLDENCEKWREAKAVTVNDGDRLYWLIGAICAS